MTTTSYNRTHDLRHLEQPIAIVNWFTSRVLHLQIDSKQ